jgi:hypothetical protein
MVSEQPSVVAALGKPRGLRLGVDVEQANRDRGNRRHRDDVAKLDALGLWGQFVGDQPTRCRLSRPA